MGGSDYLTAIGPSASPAALPCRSGTSPGSRQQGDRGHRGFAAKRCAWYAAGGGRCLMRASRMVVVLTKLVQMPHRTIGCATKEDRR